HASSSAWRRRRREMAKAPAPSARMASAPAPSSSAVSLCKMSGAAAGLGVAAGAGAGAAAAAAPAATAAAGTAGGTRCGTRVADWWVGAALCFAATVRVGVRLLTDRAVLVVEVLAAGDEVALVSGVAVGAGVVAGAGVGVGVGAVVGAGSSGTGCVCWAKAGVEESVKTAAIAVTLARACCRLVLIIMPKQPREADSGCIIIGGSGVSPDQALSYWYASEKLSSNDTFTAFERCLGHDQEAQVGRISPLFAQEGFGRKAEEPRHLQEPHRGRKARARGPVLQAR